MKWFMAVTLLLTTTSSFADSTPDMDAIQTCTAIRVAAERLDCYDALFKSGNYAGMGNKDLQTLPLGDDIVVDEVIKRPNQHVPNKPALESVAPKEQEATEEFGMNRDLAKKKGQEKKEKQEIDAVVTALRKKPFGELVIELDNGQVWEQKSASERIIIHAGDRVTVARTGLFGAYRLKGGSNVSISVKRVR